MFVLVGSIFAIADSFLTTDTDLCQLARLARQDNAVAYLRAGKLRCDRAGLAPWAVRCALGQDVEKWGASCFEEICRPDDPPLAAFIPLAKLCETRAQMDAHSVFLPDFCRRAKIWKKYLCKSYNKRARR